MHNSIEKLRARQQAGEGGFTLVELLIVIVILGILAAVVVFSVGGVKDKGLKAACKANVATMQSASEAYLANSAASAYAVDIPAIQTGGFLNSLGGELVGTSPTAVAINFPDTANVKYTVTYHPTAAAGPPARLAGSVSADHSDCNAL